jgi:ComF family protein
VEPFPVITRGAAVYHGPVVGVVHLFKYSFWPSLADQLTGLIAERLHALYPGWRPDALIPVPLHKKRLRWRGFNQSLLLAERLAEFWKTPLIEPLARVRNTTPQVRLEPEARLANITGAFSVINEESVRGKRLCILDDVSTTGSTLGECVRVLLEAGAREVRALVLALPHSPKAELL